MAKTRKILSSGQITPPVEFDYATQALMIADQSKQIADFIYFDGTAHWQYLGTVLGTIADYRALSADTTSGVVNLEFSQIQTLVTNSQLVPGRWYYMTDFQTIHLILDTTDINTGPVEPLLLLATSENTFGSRVYSPQLYPNDILEFDFNDTVCEDGITPRKGIITYRKDTVNHIQMEVDWRAVKNRRRKILSRSFTEGYSVDPTTVAIDFTSNRPNFGVFPNNFFKYEVSFQGIIHDAGSLFITLNFANGSTTKPLHLFSSLTWTANQLSGLSGSLMYNTVKDSFVLMSYGSIGVNLFNKYVCPVDSAIWTPAFGISFNVDINDYEDYLILSGSGNKNVFMNNSNVTVHRIHNYSSVCFAGCQNVDWNFGTYRSTFGIHQPGTVIQQCDFGYISDSVFEISFNRAKIGRCGSVYLVHHNTGFSTYWQRLLGGFNAVLKLPIGTNIECAPENFIYVPNGGFGINMTQRAWGINVAIFITGSSLGANVGQRVTIDAGLQKTLIGYFSSNNLLLHRVLDFTAFDETNNTSNNVFDNVSSGNLIIRSLLNPVGAVSALGRDENGNVVDATAALGNIPGAGIGLSIDGNNDIRLGDASNFVQVNSLDFLSPGFIAAIPTQTETFSLFMSEDTGTGARLFIGKDYDTANVQQLKFNSDGSVTFVDDHNLKGIAYQADYFAVGSLDNRWIPDWGAVKQVPISVKNSIGTEQFLFAANEGVRFEGTGDTTVSFNAGTKTITITSTPGAGGGTGVTSFNGRDGAVISIAGDYNTSLVTESGNLYFTEARVRSTVLTGFATNTTAITAADSVLVALGKAQGQINERVPITRTLTINGTAGRTTVTGGTQSLAANRTWAVDLVTTGVVAGTYSTVTVDVYGRVTAANNTNISTITLTGNVTGSGTTSIATTIADNAVITTKILNSNVTYAKIQNVTADRILGRTGSTGVVQELTAAQVRTLLNVADGANNYVHPTGFSNQPASALTGASVISQILVNTNGHVTGATSRTLTLANLGYTGATNADNYGNWLLAASGTAGTQSITSGATVTITAGTGITATRSGGNITISSTVTAAGTNLSIGSNTSTVVRVDSSTGNNVNLSLASNTLAGIMTASTQTIGGNKSFSGNTVIGATGASDGFQRLDVVSVANRALRLRGNATSYFGFDMSIVRTGSNSDVIGRGPSIELFNSETNRANAIQQTTGGLRFGQWNGVGWTPYYRMGENGIMYINTMTALAGGGNLQVNGAINTNSTIVTADPLNGPRHAWKLGRPGTFQDQPDATLFIRVEINGSQYDLLARHL